MSEVTFQCLRPSRFWKVARGSATWSASESDHLRTCERCRDFFARIQTAVEEKERAENENTATVLHFTLPFRAKERMQRFPLRDACDDEGVVLLPEQRLRFDGDPNLFGNFYQESDRSHWLALAHTSRPAGTLLLVEVSGENGTVLRRFVMLRPDHPVPTGRLCLEASLAVGDFTVDVSLIETAAELDADLAPVLTASFDAARREDPAAESAWRDWAAREAGREDLPRAVAAVSKEIAGSSQGQPFTGDRAATPLWGLLPPELVA
jgi:hypothetical protein